MNSIWVNGSDWVAAAQGECASGHFGVRLMRVARVTGKFKAVLLAAGRATPNEESSNEELFEQIERAVLTEADDFDGRAFKRRFRPPALAGLIAVDGERHFLWRVQKGACSRQFTVHLYRALTH